MSRMSTMNQPDWENRRCRQALPADQAATPTTMPQQIGTLPPPRAACTPAAAPTPSAGPTRPMMHGAAPPARPAAATATAAGGLASSASPPPHCGPDAHEGESFSTDWPRRRLLRGQQGPPGPAPSIATPHPCRRSSAWPPSPARRPARVRPAGDAARTPGPAGPRLPLGAAGFSR